MISDLLTTITELFEDSGFYNMDYKQIIMIIISCFLIYLAIAKKYEPLLLLPIAFGMLLVNLPGSGLMTGPLDDGSGSPGGLFYYLSMGLKLGIFPPLIFLGIGAMTDFGPLIANPKSLLLGAAAQIGGNHFQGVDC